MPQNRVWILQTNPKHYDIDAALRELDRIWWRVPQHTGDIHVGDAVALWRSGKDARVVGVGRVVTEPQLRPPERAEKPFLRPDEEEPDEVTRALIRVQAGPFVAKEQLRAIPEFSQHLILRVPMGTVFAVSDEEWAALRPLLPSPPDLLEGRRAPSHRLSRGPSELKACCRCWEATAAI
jgi:hypothetical protein